MSWISEMIFTIDQVSFKASFGAQQMVAISREGILLDERELIFSQSILALNHVGDCLGLGNPSPPLFTDNDTRIWNMSILPVAMNNLEQSNDSILLFASEDSVITDCEILHNPTTYAVRNGPSLIIGTGDAQTQNWIGSVEFVNDSLVIENPGSTDVELNIEFDGNGPQWGISNEIILASGQTTIVSATAPVTGQSYSWLELNDGEVILHLVNHEV